MARIEGIRIQNFRVLRDVTLGKLSHEQGAEPLTPLTVVIGRNGCGKTTLFDAFGFLSDCLNSGVEAACDMQQRGGFDRLVSRGSSGPIRFEVYYREGPQERPISYELSIGLDRSSRPYVEAEVLRQRRKGESHGRPFAFLRLDRGKGTVWSGSEAVESGTEDAGSQPVELTDPRQLGIATLGTLREHPRITRFRDFLKGWYLSYFAAGSVRHLAPSGPQLHLNVHGDNMANVVQFMEREYPGRFRQILALIATKIPGVERIETKVTDDKRILLRFNDGSYQDPFVAQQMSDGTLKMFAYLLMLEDPSPPPFICIEEPENGLYHKLLAALGGEFREFAVRHGGPQMLVTTHQPHFVNALSPGEVWLLHKGDDGFARALRASDLPLVRNLVAEGLELGGLWFSEYLEPM